MEAIARARFVRSSARKLRRVAALIKGKNVAKALATLSYTPKYASLILEKTVKSAAANALAREGTAKLKAEDLVVRNILVDGGPQMKRIRPAPMGRAFLIRKRLAHLTVVLEEDPEVREARLKQAKIAAEKKTAKKSEPEKKPAKAAATKTKKKEKEE